MGAHPQDTFERFFKHVDQSGGPDACWLWCGSLCGPGYGKTTLNQKRIMAHRAAWVIAYGPIPDRMAVLHHCDNRRCVNLAHLWLGSQRDNLRDMTEKGRRAAQYGAANMRHKLTEDNVRAIRRLLAEGWTQYAIARHFKVSQPTIYHIKAGYSWWWLP